MIIQLITVGEKKPVILEYKKISALAKRVRGLHADLAIIHGAPEEQWEELWQIFCHVVGTPEGDILFL